MAIDYLSLSTTPIILRNNDTVVSQGTGFLFLRERENEQVLFLVTNYHVLTGSAPEKKNHQKVIILNGFSIQIKMIHLS